MWKATLTKASASTTTVTLRFRQLPPATTSRAATPATGSRPAQLGIAVRRNPATTAPPYPKIISCACQSIGEKAVGTATSPAKNGGKMAMPTSAQTPAARKNGRKPRLRIAGPRSARLRAAASRSGASNICVISLELSVGSCDRAKNGYCRSRQQHNVGAKYSRKHPLRVVSRASGDASVLQRLDDENDDHEQRPNQDHRVHPPERRLAESRPKIEAPGHPEAGEAGQGNRDAHLRGEPLLD